jgi:hypothetical protein
METRDMGKGEFLKGWCVTLPYTALFLGNFPQWSNKDYYYQGHNERHQWSNFGSVIGVILT